MMKPYETMDENGGLRTAQNSRPTSHPGKKRASERADLPQEPDEAEDAHEAKRAHDADAHH